MIPAKQLRPVFLTMVLLAGNAFSQIDVTHYRAEIRFDIAARTLSAKAEVHVRNGGTQPISTVTLHLRDLTVSKVEEQGRTIGFSQGNGELAMVLNSSLASTDSTILEIEYGGSATDEGGGQAWGGCFWGATSFSMGVGFTAPYVSMTRHWLPSNDIPSDKATFDLTYIVPEGLVAAGTGRLVDVKNKNGHVEYRWVEDHPTATYLVTYAIRDYAVLDDAWNSLPLQYFVGKQDSVKAISYFATVPQMLDAFTARYGGYPFDKVGYCITPFGAMEHQTMISYPQSLLTTQSLAGSTAAHELAHQWWGDWVTPADFREAWLSEGFATFSEAVYAEHVQGPAAYYQTVRQFISRYRNQVEFSEGLLPLYDFPRQPPSSNYPQTIYQKGASVLAMLRHIMGEQVFFSGLREYGRRFAYGNASTGDLKNVMEDFHGTSLDWFFDPWIYRKGYPQYTIQRLISGVTDPFRIRILQTQDTSLVPLFRMPLDLMIVRTTGDTILTQVEHDAVVSQEFSFPGIPSETVSTYLIDPLGVVLKRLSYRTVDAAPEPLPEPHGMHLDSIFPNPVSTDQMRSTVIPFRIGIPQRIRVEVLDLLGRLVAFVHEGVFDSGPHHVTLPGMSIPAGVYAVRLSGASEFRMKPLLIGR